MLLCVRPPFIPHESLASYIHRVALYNHYQSTSFFIPLLGITPAKINNNELDSTSIKIVSNLTNINEEDIKRMTIKSFRELGYEEELLNKIILKNRVKYCVECICEVSHHKLKWILLPVTVCLKHGSSLIDHCLKCQRFISMDSFIQGICKSCGFVYKDAESRKIACSSILYESQEEIQNRLLSSRTGNNLYDNFTSSQYLYLIYQSFYLLEGLNSFIDSSQIQFFSNKKESYYNNRRLALAYANVFWMYKDFPINFYKVLDRFNEKSWTVKYAQKAHFEKLLKNDCYRHIKEAYNHYWIEQLNRGRIRADFSIFKEESALLQQREFLPKEEVKRISPIVYKKLDQLESQQHLPVTRVRYKNKRKVMVEKKAIYKLAYLETLFIAKCKAATILGIQKDSIEKLITAGFLTLKKSPVNKWMLHIDDIEKLLIKYRGKYIEDTEGIPFYKALIKYSANGLTIVKILEYVNQGHLHPFTKKQDGNLSDSIYKEDELEKCLKLLKDEKQQLYGYYMKDVMRLLNIGEKAMRKMMEKQILVPYRIITMKDGRQRYLFDKKDIDEFVSNHITVSEAIKQFKVPVNKLRFLIKKGDLSDVSKGTCKGFLINRDELITKILQSTK